MTTPISTLLRLDWRPDGWWIINPDPASCDCGPYATKQEAESDLKGLKRAYREEEKSS